MPTRPSATAGRTRRPRPEVRAEVARLPAHGLTLDAWCYHPQLADVIALARAVPEATIVMCHAGGVLGYASYAGKKDEVHAAWRSSMAELARCPNVSVKLGGMLNRGAALNFRELPAPPNSAAWAAAWRPYVEPCIALFGADRCNFESNFPVDKMGTGYATLWNAFKRITTVLDVLRAKSSPSTAGQPSGSTASIEAGRTIATIAPVRSRTHGNVAGWDKNAQR